MGDLTDNWVIALALLTRGRAQISVLPCIIVNYFFLELTLVRIDIVAILRSQKRDKILAIYLERG
jgi:hypothetical protein